MQVHLSRLKTLAKKRSIGGWVFWALAVFWKRLGDWQNVEWIGRHVPKLAWPEAMLHSNYLTIIFVLSGATWFTAILLWPRRQAEQVEQNGPDLSLEWKPIKTYPYHDLIRLKNIGTSSAFNIGLRFSWPELSFMSAFNINVLHADKEIEAEAHVGEETQPGHTNLGRMDEALRRGYLRDRTPLEVVLSFFDQQRNAFEKSFTLEIGSGGTTSERIRITPGKRKVLQATS